MMWGILGSWDFVQPTPDGDRLMFGSVKMVQRIWIAFAAILTIPGSVWSSRRRTCINMWLLQPSYYGTREPIFAATRHCINKWLQFCESSERFWRHRSAHSRGLLGDTSPPWLLYTSRRGKCQIGFSDWQLDMRVYTVYFYSYIQMCIYSIMFFKLVIAVYRRLRNLGAPMQSYTLEANQTTQV